MFVCCLYLFTYVVDSVLRVSVTRKPKRQSVMGECVEGCGAVKSGVYVGSASGQDVQ